MPKFGCARSSPVSNWARWFVRVRASPMIVVHQPIGVAIDVHVADLVPQAGAEQVVGILFVRHRPGQTADGPERPSRSSQPRKKSAKRRIEDVSGIQLDP